MAASGAEIFYFIVYCPADTTLDELIRIGGSRWAVEECFQTAKQGCGLDDYLVRRYPGWHRNMTLAVAAHACHDRPAGPRAGCGESRNGSSQLIHISLAEIRRLITHLTERRPTRSTTSCTGWHGAVGDNTRPASATTTGGATARGICPAIRTLEVHPGRETPPPLRRGRRHGLFRRSAFQGRPQALVVCASRP